jgi:hypothetical protein
MDQAIHPHSEGAPASAAATSKRHGAKSGISTSHTANRRNIFREAE